MFGSPAASEQPLPAKALIDFLAPPSAAPVYRHHKPETTFGNVKADVLADKDPSFRPENFCRVIRASAWPG
jgi:hypothetical protein